MTVVPGGSRPYRAAVSTTVVLEVTPLSAVDPDRFVSAPHDVTAVLRAAGQPGLACGLSRRGRGPWRLHFPLSGRDRVAVGQSLERRFRQLGYDADLSCRA